MDATTILTTPSNDERSASHWSHRHRLHRLVAVATLACIGLAAGCTGATRTTAGATREPQPAAPSEGIVPITTRSDRARAAFLAGREHQASGRIDEARAAYEHALAADPELAQAHVFHGAVSTDADARARSFQRALELAATLPAAEQSFIAAVIAAHDEDATTLAAALDRLTRLASRDVEVLRWVASVAGSRGSPGAALPALERIVALVPDATADHAELAYTYAALDRPRDAAAASARYVELAPADPNAWDTHGEMLLLAGDLDDAERAFRRALTVDASFSSADHGLAMVRFHRGDRAGGIEALLAGIATVPVEDTTYTRVRLLENLAVAHALAGDEQDAMDAMLASIEAQHLDEATARAVSHMGRARLLLLTQQWERAQAEAESARKEAAPPFVVAAALAVEVRALAGAGDAAGARAAYATLAGASVGGHPALVEAAFFVALVEGQLDDASATLGRLGALDPYAAELASLALAHAFRKAGRDPDARALLHGITRLHRRSAQSAHVRRAAAAELASMGSAAATEC